MIDKVYLVPQRACYDLQGPSGTILQAFPLLYSSFFFLHISTSTMLEFKAREKSPRAYDEYENITTRQQCRTSHNLARV
jgi:hypothetical protein